MSGQQVGVNPAEANAGGQQVVAGAEQFAGLSTDFQNAVSGAQTSAVEQPCAAGYGPFGERYVSALTQVMYHAGALGGNAQAGAAYAVDTDQTNTGGYVATGLVTGDSAAATAATVPADQTLLQRLRMLDGQIDAGNLDATSLHDELRVRDDTGAWRLRTINEIDDTAVATDEAGDTLESLGFDIDGDGVATGYPGPSTSDVPPAARTTTPIATRMNLP